MNNACRPRKIIGRSDMTKKRTGRTETPIVLDHSTHRGSVSNDNVHKNINDEGRPNYVEYHQGSDLPQMKRARNFREYYGTKRYKFEPRSVGKKTIVPKRQMQLQDPLTQETERNLKQKDANLSILQLKENLNTSRQHPTDDHKGKRVKKMLIHTVFELILLSSLPKVLKHNVITIYESASYIF